MAIFGRKREVGFEDEVEVEETSELKPRKIKDLNPENKKRRKEVLKPWGFKERIFVLIVFILTILTSGALALTARNFKLPKLPQFKIPNLGEINPFKEQVIVVGNRGSNVSIEKIDSIKKKFKEATNDYSGIYSFYIYDLNGDYYYGYKHQEIMQAASLIKLPTMYLTFKKFENGELEIEKYEAELEAMGKRSDNSSFIRMVNLLEKEEINKVTLEIGMPNTSISENLTTPEEIGLFFKKLYRNELLNGENTEKFKNYLTDTNFEKWLRLGIPNDVKLIHKYGREVHSVSDAGIVMGNKPFVLVIMTDGVIEKEADELFPKLTKMLYDNQIGISE
jgi:hypothetical protein